MEKQQTAVEWFSNRAYELFEQYSEGKFDRIRLNKLMFEATNKAKEMEKEQIINAVDGFPLENRNLNGTEYYEQTYGGNK
jgi:hypothetical protein